MRVLIVGNNLSPKSPDPTVPLTGIRSGTILIRWLESLKIEGLEFHVINMSSRTSKIMAESVFNNGEVSVVAAFSKSCDAVIALGRKVGMALTRAQVAHFEMPHPSRLNRKLNNPHYVEEQLRQCEAYLQQQAQVAGRRRDEEGRNGPDGLKDRRARTRRDRTGIRQEIGSDPIQPGESG
jgi:hypothetical protein